MNVYHQLPTAGVACSHLRRRRTTREQTEVKMWPNRTEFEIQGMLCVTSSGLNQHLLPHCDPPSQVDCIFSTVFESALCSAQSTILLLFCIPSTFCTRLCKHHCLTFRTAPLPRWLLLCSFQSWFPAITQLPHRFSAEWRIQLCSLRFINSSEWRSRNSSFHSKMYTLKRRPLVSCTRAFRGTQRYTLVPPQYFL